MIYIFVHHEGRNKHCLCFKDKENMSLQLVLEQYAKHIHRLMRKPASRKRDMGLAYYIASAERVQALMDAPTPAGVGAQGKFVRL